MSKIVQLKDPITNEDVYPVVARSELDYEEVAGTSNTTPLEISYGGTGATTAENACSNLGIADYIIERGTSGNWYYEKWNSGWCKMWGTIQYSEITTNTAHANTYYNPSTGIKSTTIPGIKKIINAIGKETPSMSSGVWLYNYSFDNSVITAQFRSHASLTNGVCAVIWHIVGYWK